MVIMYNGRDDAFGQQSPFSNSGITSQLAPNPCVSLSTKQGFHNLDSEQSNVCLDHGLTHDHSIDHDPLRPGQNVAIVNANRNSMVLNRRTYVVSKKKKKKKKKNQKSENAL